MVEAATRLIERLARVLQNDAHKHGLKPAQWEALRYLAAANRFSRSPGALTAWLGVTKGTVSQTLQALERKGLIEKRPAPGDRRGVRLDLTEAGDRLLADDPMGDLDAAVAGLPREAREALGASLEAVLKAMLARRGGRPFGACRSCMHFRPNHDRGAPHLCNLLNEPLSVEDGERICVEQEAAA
ncbi:MAG: winged helix-turn-helix transcriptional regulator [Geminicoccaceae bacterium]|nr:winged helix-turn-helix transcriptional regulator [Geminicoccaceae bacterium]